MVGDGDPLVRGRRAPAYWSFDEGHPFFIILNLAVGGWFDKPHLPPAEMAPQRLYVDYVRVYRRTAGS